LIAQQELTNVVFVSGDWHVYGVMDVLRDFDDPVSSVVATEFGGVSISGVGPWAPVMKANMPNNTHVRYIEGDDLRGGVNVHGYTTCQVTAEEITTELRALDNVKLEDSNISTIATFVVTNGVPGAQRLDVEADEAISKSSAP
jgi:alkaline phosphatase D